MAGKDGIRVHVYGDYDDKEIKKAIRGLEGLRTDAVRSQTAFAGFSKSMLGVGTAIGVGFAAFRVLSSAISGSIDEANEAIKVNAATAQIIKATGGAAQVTADQVADLSQNISDQVGADDELIQSSANLILTFKNVANQGTGLAAIFDRTVLAAQDLSAAGFGDAASAAKMLGKALNDPERGLTALSRAGVTFTQQQKEQIKTLTEGGDVLKAQQLILAEVESQVGGVAAATVTATDRLSVMFANMQENIGLALMPLIEALADDLGPILEELGPLLADIARAVLSVVGPAFTVLLGIVGGVASALRALSGDGGIFTVIVRTLAAAVAVLTVAMVANRVATMLNLAAYGVTGIAAMGLVRAIDLTAAAMTRLNIIMRANAFVLLATVVIAAAVAVNEFNSAANKTPAELDSIRAAQDKFRKSTNNFEDDFVGLNRGFVLTAQSSEKYRGVLSATVTSAITAGNAIRTGLVPALDEAAIAAFGAYKEFIKFAQVTAQSTKTTADQAERGVTAAEAIDTLAKSTSSAGSSAAAATAKFVKLNEVLPDLVATGAEFGVNFAPSLKIPNSEKLIDRLKESFTALKDRLDKAKAEATDFGNSIADTFRGFLSIADASDAFQARQKAAVDALVELNAYRATMTAESTDDQKAKLQELADAHNRADTAARTGAQSIVAEFMAQAEEFGKFGEKMRRLLAAGLNKTTFTQIMSMGAERGGDVADAYLNGNTAELVAQTNNTVKAYDDLATTIGDQSAQTFYAAGISAAVAILRAFSKAMGKDGSTRKGLKAIIADLQDDMQINVKVNIPNVPSFQSAAAPVESAGAAGGGFDFGSIGPITGIPNIPAGGFDLSGIGGIQPFANGGLVKGPMLGLVGEAGPELIVPLDRLNGARSGSVINVTVNAGMGTDGAQVGEQIVSALRAYERRNGALPITVAS